MCQSHNRNFFFFIQLQDSLQILRLLELSSPIRWYLGFKICFFQPMKCYQKYFKYLKCFSFPRFDLCLPITCLLRWRSGKESACQCKRPKRSRFDLWVWKVPWNWKLQPPPGFLPGKSHGQRSLQSMGLQKSWKPLSTHMSNLFIFFNDEHFSKWMSVAHSHSVFSY